MTAGEGAGRRASTPRPPAVLERVAPSCSRGASWCALAPAMLGLLSPSCLSAIHQETGYGEPRATHETHRDDLEERRTAGEGGGTECRHVVVTGPLERDVTTHRTFATPLAQEANLATFVLLGGGAASPSSSTGRTRPNCPDNGGGCGAVLASQIAMRGRGGGPARVPSSTTRSASATPRASSRSPPSASRAPGARATSPSPQTQAQTEARRNRPPRSHPSEQRVDAGAVVARTRPRSSRLIWNRTSGNEEEASTWNRCSRLGASPGSIARLAHRREREREGALDRALGPPRMVLHPPPGPAERAHGAAEALFESRPRERHLVCDHLGARVEPEGAMGPRVAPEDVPARHQIPRRRPRHRAEVGVRGVGSRVDVAAEVRGLALDGLVDRSPRAP